MTTTTLHLFRGDARIAEARRIVEMLNEATKLTSHATAMAAGTGAHKDAGDLLTLCHSAYIAARVLQESLELGR